MAGYCSSVCGRGHGIVESACVRAVGARLKNVYGSAFTLVAGNRGSASVCASRARVCDGLRASWSGVGHLNFLLSCLEAPGAHMSCMGVESGCAPQRSGLYNVFPGFVSLCAFCLCALWPLNIHAYT